MQGVKNFVRGYPERLVDLLQRKLGMATDPARALRPKVQAVIVLMGAILCSLAIAADQIGARLGLPASTGTLSNSDSAAKVALGKRLFFDKRLSRDGTIACASCHRPERAFSDGLAVARGIGQKLSTRNTPSLLNATFNETQFWDGRRPDLASQALDPLTNPREHGLRDQGTLIDILQKDAQYVEAFQAAFSAPRNSIKIEQVAQALASFERTLLAGDSAFDRYYFNQEKSALSPAAVRGLALFQETARCATCHTIERTHALFTDNRFHSLSVGLPRLAPVLAQITTRLVQANASKVSLDNSILNEDDIAQLGRFAVTLNPPDIGKFRTPSLRNVAETAPYMHDGSVATLEDAVELELYYRLVQAERPVILTPSEKTDLVEFLKSLSTAQGAR